FCPFTTKRAIPTGDGVSMLYREKGQVRQMEFIQFHPTALYNPGEYPSFLISDALRGAGAVLKDHKGREFMEQYDKRKSLAPRDIVARSIDAEIKKQGGECVYMDIRHVSKEELLCHIHIIYAMFLMIGIVSSVGM